MAVPTITGGGSGAGGSGPSAVTTTASPSLARQDFLQLLVTQLRNQDPLTPMNDREFISQMAQLSALEATTGLATQIEDLLVAQQQTQALSLVGREVEYVGADGETRTGRVREVRFDGGVPILQIDDQPVSLGWIKAVK